ncbi:MAG: hypothetical protein K2Q09_00405, partial [Phycisphaerales bacterium]|nr:hypothetical protein [Phycisphaerales bacterium]
GVIKRHKVRMFEYIDRLIDVPDDTELGQSFDISPDILHDSVYAIHSHVLENAAEIRLKLTPDARETGNLSNRLEKILIDLGPPIQMQSAERR